MKDIPELRDAGFDALAKSCKELRVLALGGWLHITDNSIQALSTNCPHLEILDMVNITTNTKRGLSPLPSFSLRKTGCAKLGEESLRMISEGVFKDKLTTLLAYGKDSFYFFRFLVFPLNSIFS